MTDTLNIANPYVRRARLQPAMIVALPIALATLAWKPTGIAGWSVFWSLFVWCGGTALLAQVARDRGKRKEPDLYRSWGGKPTTRFLRHRDAPNKTVLGRRHQKLQRIVTGIQIPTIEEERENPVKADDAYDACTAFLLEKTRDKKRFSLVFEENCNYGFRRNLWGLKPLGITTSVVGTAAAAAVIVFNHQSGITTAPLAIICAVINILLLIGWLVWFTPNWVRIPAEAYAERLLAACENL